MENYKKDLVSLITPGWRGREFVHRLLDSIIAQTYRPIEYIYVDDCSNDGTLDIVKGYSDRFRDAGIDFTIIERKENGGLSETIMEGLRHVHAEFFSCPEYDDILFPSSVSTRVDYLKSHPECAVVTADAWVVTEDKLDERKTLISHNNPNRFEKKHFLPSLVTQSIYNSACIMIRTEMFDKTHTDRRFYPSRMGINQQVLLPLYYHYERGFISEPQSLFVVRNDSVSHSDNVTLKQKLTKLDEYHRIIFSTLDSIAMPRAERDGYKQIVDINFHKDYIQLGFDYNDRELFLKAYDYLKRYDSLPEGSDAKKQIVCSAARYWWNLTRVKKQTLLIYNIKVTVYNLHRRFKSILLVIWNFLWDVKASTVNMYYEVKDCFVRFLTHKPNVMSLEETLRYIISNKCSVARYGDGEMKFVIGTRTWFQPTSLRLKQRLIEILKQSDSKLLVCIPGIFGTLDIYAPEFKDYWRKYVARHRQMWYHHIDNGNVYGEAFISRCYLPYRDRSHAQHYFELWKQLWQGRDLLIAEGAKTRLGVGNDLFDNVSSIKRILVPNTDAFAHYDGILAEIQKYSQSHLVLLALGPTATVLAADLCLLGYQAIDLGHIDIEYEWMRMGVDHKVPVENKFVNEAGAGEGVGDSADDLYLNQIVEKIGC